MFSDKNNRCIADMLFQLGRVYHDQEAYEDALNASQEALEIQQDLLPPEHVDIIDTSFNIAMTYYLRGSPKALKMHTSVHSLALRSLPQGHPIFMRILKDVYLLLREIGEEKEAEYALGKMMERCREPEDAVSNLIDRVAVLCGDSNNATILYPPAAAA